MRYVLTNAQMRAADGFTNQRIEGTVFDLNGTGGSGARGGSGKNVSRGR